MPPGHCVSCPAGGKVKRSSREIGYRWPIRSESSLDDDALALGRRRHPPERGRRSVTIEKGVRMARRRVNPASFVG